MPITADDIDRIMSEDRLTPEEWMAKWDIPIETMWNMNRIHIEVITGRKKQGYTYVEAVNDVLANAFRAGWDSALAFAKQDS
jgi:hypothetical protein